MEKGSNFRTIISTDFETIPNLPLCSVTCLWTEWSYLIGHSLALLYPFVGHMRTFFLLSHVHSGVATALSGQGYTRLNESKMDSEEKSREEADSAFQANVNWKTLEKVHLVVTWRNSPWFCSQSLVKVGHLCLTLCNPTDSNPWNSPGQNTGVGSLSLLQGILPTQGSNPGFPHCRWILYQLSHKGSPRILEWIAYPFSSRSSRPRNCTRISCIAGRFFTNWANREALLKV